MRAVLADIPFAPLAFVVGLLLAGAFAGRIGRAAGSGPVRGFLLGTSIALILAFTLTPGRGEFAQPAAFTCDFSRIGPASVATYLSINNVSLNVALFVPLGAVIPVLPPSRRRTALVVLGACLPFVIESIQSALPDLGRTCQAGDLFDNVAGLVVGLCGGAAATAVLRTIRS
jgi:hypothetical protein